MSELSYQDVKKAFDEAERALRYADLSINNLSTKAASSVDLSAACASACPRLSSGPRNREGVVVPAVNELRYAGKHLIGAIWFQSCNRKEEEQEQLRRANRHCIRARYDALRATALFLIRDYRQFSDDYRFIIHHVEGAEEHRRIIEEVLEFLCQHTSEDSDEILGEECDKFHDAIEKLKPIFLHSSSQRGKLNELLDQAKKQEELIKTQGKSGNRTTVKWAVIALISSCIFFVLGYFLSSR